MIELVVVIIIIGVLVLLATPRFLKTIKLARYTQIINDIRVTEDVSIAYMIKNRELPKNKGLVKEEDLIKQVEESKSYLKNGLIQLKDSENKKVDVGNIKLVDKDDLKGFYLLDKELFIRPETRTRLKGDFLINQDGISIYVDKKGYDWNIEEGGQDIENPETKPEPGEPEEPQIPEEPEEPESKYDGIFIFNSNAIEGVIPGREENFKDLIRDDGNRFIIPKELKDSNGDLQSVKSIANEAFKNQTHNQFMEIIDFTEAAELESIDESAFEGNKIEEINFTDVKKLRQIKFSAFKNNQISKLIFKGNTGLLYIEKEAFKNNQIIDIDFKGMSLLNTIADSAFENNRIRKIDLSKNKNLRSIHPYAFKMQASEFVNEIILPPITDLNLIVIRNSDIFGEFDPSNKNTSINNVYSNEDSKITQTFIRENEEGIWIKKGLY